MNGKYANKYKIDTSRLKAWDYSNAGGYFVIICVKNRHCIFGNIVDGCMSLSPMGLIACDCWQNIPDHFNNVDLDVFVIMPNHIHGVLVLN